MNCKEFQELVTAAVDEYLPEESLRGFREHAQRCPPCARVFELERLTKELVRSRVRKVKAPGTVAAGILDHLTDVEEVPSEPHAPRRLLSRRVAFTVAATVLASIVFLLVFPSDRHIGPGVIDEGRPLDDMIAQSQENYRAVLNGAIEAQVISRRANDLVQFFEGKTEFPVVLPVLKNTSSVGALLNRSPGRRLAHLIYTHQDGPIYVYETCWKNVQAEGPTRCLPSRVVDELTRGGRYVETIADGLTSVVWTNGSTLCIAVSSLPREKFLAMLTSDGEVTPRR